jgi:hypothetical protein
LCHRLRTEQGGSSPAPEPISCSRRAVGDEIDRRENHARLSLRFAQRSGYRRWLDSLICSCELAPCRSAREVSSSQS